MQVVQKRPVFVVVAHQDDWQLFMGSDVYAHLRDRDARVVIIVTTAGNGPHAEFHWKSRLSGAVVSVLRALPSWSPYRLHDSAQPSLPAAFGVTYSRVTQNGKAVLQCTIDDANAAEIRLYFMHFPDMGALTNLREAGIIARMLWPEDDPSDYASWEEFEMTIEAIMLSERGRYAETLLVHAADPDADANPGDHPDHRLTSQAIETIARRHPIFTPVWFSMYCNASEPENLDGCDADDQRAAIFAYGGGYMATAAGFGETWRTGWEHEYPAFKKREYPKRGRNGTRMP